MFKHKIKYEDFNGLEREETFYFHISKAEMTRLELTTEGGFTERLEKLIGEKDSVKLYKLFEQFIDLSYGEMSEDGKRIIKKKNGVPLVEEFKESPAYDEFILWLFDFNNALEFVRNIFPKDVTNQIKADEMKEQVMKAIS